MFGPNRQPGLGKPMFFIGAGVVVLTGACSTVIEWLSGGALQIESELRADSGPDEDRDGLPDEIERLLGTYTNWSDSDGDGYDDGTEFVLDSDPLDAASLPEFVPALRTLAHEIDDTVRIFVAVYPGNAHLIEDFEMLLSSPEFEGEGIGDSQYPVLQSTSLMASAIVEFALEETGGLHVLGFTFVLPANLLEELSPLSVAIAAKLAGETVINELVLLQSSGQRMVMAAARAGLAPSGSAPTFSLMPLAATFGGDDQDPAWCEMSLGPETPYGTAGVQQQVEDADCVARGVLTCIDEECEEQVGTTVVHVDHGFLYDRVD